ncbi:MAG TPA: hypothetical protein VGO65_10545 [Pseudolysinimonas sp.]|nr:hypothetical protein [Pseudolysinimonas sp.]
MTVVLRVGLAVLAATMLVVGAWNEFWPREFFDHFPTVSLLPPYSEHFARDYGGTSLGLGVVLAAAALFPRTILVIPALLGIWAWALPHFVFHMSELDHGTEADAAFNIVATGGAAVLPPVLLLVAVLRMTRDRRALHDPPVG